MRASEREREREREREEGGKQEREREQVRMRTVLQAPAQKQTSLSVIDSAANAPQGLLLFPASFLYNPSGLAVPQEPMPATKLMFSSLSQSHPTYAYTQFSVF